MPDLHNQPNSESQPYLEAPLKPISHQHSIEPARRNLPKTSISSRHAHN
jgi:hypothetical protein